MRVLVVGGGGREHALCWALSRSGAVLWCAPGNPGTAELATNLPISADDIPGLLDAVEVHRIDLAVIGPEAPLAAGLVDRLRARGTAAFGPTASAARLESSKAFAKDVMAAAGVPTARSRTFTTRGEAERYIRAHPEPLVVKASGLAGGKGAVVCSTTDEALAAAAGMFEGRFGDAGREVLVEEFMPGEELSLLVLTDGERSLVLPPSQDHKRLGDGDTGPNTGGMGAYTPVTLGSKQLVATVVETIVNPTLNEMLRRGARYSGLLYAGIMVGKDGAPRVVEFNCRFGDPETQAVLPTITDDLMGHIWRIAAQEEWIPPATLRRRGAAVTTVLAAQGYPDAPKKGAEITLPDPLPSRSILFHAGTTQDQRGKLRVAGGRVLNATGLGADVATAAEASRQLAEAIQFDGKVFRQDIGWREVRRARAS